MNLFPSFVIDKRRFYNQNSTHLFVVLPNKGTRVRVNSNYIQILLLGLCVGVTLGIAFIPLFDSFDCQGLAETDAIPNPSILTPVEGKNVNKDIIAGNPSKPVNDQSRPPAMRRPRFYSTELGLKKKLIVGVVLTDHTRIDNLIAINATLSPFVGQILFFVTGQSVAKKVRSLGLSNVVCLPPENIRSKGIRVNEAGGNGTLHLDKPMYNKAALKVVKYFGGKVVDNFDYFFVGLDLFYINGRSLIKAVRRISISQEVLWGAAEGTACSLEKGFVLSRSLIKKLSFRIDRCFRKSVQAMSHNLTKCFQYALGSTECSNSVQNERYLSISADRMYKIAGAITIGPVSSSEEFYQLHIRIAGNRAMEIGQEIKRITRIIEEMVPRIPKGFEISSWPKGLPMPHRPLTRFDVLRWKYFTSNNIYPRNEHITEAVPDGIDELDIYSVVNVSTHYLRDVLHKNEDSSIAFRNGYRRFDETRGMEYLLDFLDEDGETHRVECLRPLSYIEVVPVPFVTENRRLTIVVPVKLDQYNQTDDFLTGYFDTTVDKKSNSVLILAIIVNEPNPGGQKASQLDAIKQLVFQHNSNQSKRYNRTTSSSDFLKVGYVIVNMRQFKTSNFALALFDTLGRRVLSPNALVLVIDSFVRLKDEFINRVRMNTILNTQVFSPIPFMQYNSRISGHQEDENGHEVHRTTGYFDSSYFGFFSFFVADFITVRKQISNQVMMEAANNHIGVSILPNLFLQGSQLHVLRAAEPSLVVKFPINILANCLDEQCFKTQWGSKEELAKLILNSSA